MSPQRGTAKSMQAIILCKLLDQSCGGERMPDLARRLDALLPVIVANVAPWAAGWLFSGHWRAPLDGGATFADGSHVLGDHKTWPRCGCVVRLSVRSGSSANRWKLPELHAGPGRGP